MKTHKEGEPRKMTISVNGPVASGKTTMIKHIKSILIENGYNIIEVCPRETSHKALKMTIESHDVTIGEF